MLSGKLFGIMLLKGTANISQMVRESKTDEMLAFLNDAASGIRSAYVASEKARKAGQTMFDIEGEILPLVSIEHRDSAITTLRATYRKAQSRATDIDGHWAQTSAIQYKAKTGFYLAPRKPKDEDDADSVTDSATVTESTPDVSGRIIEVEKQSARYRMALEQILAMSKSKEIKKLISETLAA